MNYLIVEGYKEGAVCFQKESGVECDEDFDTELIEARAIIKQLICDGDIEEATKAINDLNPEVSNLSRDSGVDIGQKCRTLLQTQETAANRTHQTEQNLRSYQVCAD